MINKEYISFLIISILTIIVLVGCNKNSALKNNSDMDEVSVKSQYEYYETLDEITSESDIVIYGKVIKVDEPTKINTSLEKENEDYEVYTVSTLEVVNVLKGNIAVGDKVKVKQFGGIYENVNYIEESIEYLQPSGEGIFFLESYGPFTSEEMPYSLLNLSQGHFKFVDGKIEQENHMDEPRTDLFGNFKSKEEILELINDNINTSNKKINIDDVTEMNIIALPSPPEFKIIAMFKRDGEIVNSLHVLNV